MEVCSLSSGVMLFVLNPYPFHYKMAFAFSIFPYLLFYDRPLRAQRAPGFPCGRTTGLPPLALSAAEGFRVDTRVT